MSQVRTRENTFKVDLSNFPKRPSIEELQKFVLVNLGLAVGQVKRFQVNHAQNCAHVKCVDLKTAQDAVAKHDGKHEMDVNKTKVKVRLVMEDGGVEVKIHDLSENVTSEEIVAFLRNYGDVLNIREVPWGESFPLRGMPSGIRVAKMVLRRHIKSFVTIQSEQTLISYRGQPQTCKHCTLTQHVGISCVENKKILNQKADLNARLDKNRGSTSTSYASVLNTSASATNTLLPAFSSTILGPVMPQRPPPIVLESTAPNGSLSQATTNVAGQPAAGSTIISENTAQSVHTDEQMDVAELSVGYTSGGSPSSNAQNILTRVIELSAESAAAASGGGAIVCPKESERSSEPTVDASVSDVMLSPLSPTVSAAPAAPAAPVAPAGPAALAAPAGPAGGPAAPATPAGPAAPVAEGETRAAVEVEDMETETPTAAEGATELSTQHVHELLQPYDEDAKMPALPDYACLALQLYSVGSVEPNTNFPSNRPVDSASEANIRAMDEITTEEIFTAIKTSASRKSPGPDGIPKEFYEKAFDIIYRQLNLILNEALQGQFPDQFLEGVVVLSKKNSNLKTIKGYRPITLLNYDYKLLSRVLKAIARELAYVPHSLATNPTATELHDFYRKTLSKPKVMAERSATSWRLVWHNIRCKRFTSAERSTYYLLVNHKISHAALLFRQNRQDSEMCQHCPNVVEDLKHKFTNCSRVKHLWEYLQPKLEAILDRRVRFEMF
ncbi:hypothetical protein quinque_002311 [Culex quinquefasciatus]